MSSFSKLITVGVFAASTLAFASAAQAQYYYQQPSPYGYTQYPPQQYYQPPVVSERTLRNQEKLQRKQAEYYQRYGYGHQQPYGYPQYQRVPVNPNPQMQNRPGYSYYE